MALVKNIVLAVIGFSGGVVISGAVFALITVLGIVPRFAKKTGTVGYVKVYEEAIIIGGICASLCSLFKPHIPVGKTGAVIFSLCVGVFLGCFAVSLAEVLNTIPILMRRARLMQGMLYFVLALALGKMMGSLLYFLVPGYYYY